MFDDGSVPPVPLSRHTADFSLPCYYTFGVDLTMSLLDVAPIIEQMLLVSDNVSDLNFSCGQKPQVEINGVLYPSSPIGLGRLTAYQTEMIAMSLIRDNPDAAAQLVKFRTADVSY